MLLVLLAAALSADPDDFVWSITEPQTLFEPGPGERGSFPVAVSLDRADGGSVLFVGVPQNEDVASAASVSTLLRSTDGGQSFTSGRPGAMGTNLGRDPEGALLDVGFIPIDFRAGDTELRLSLYRSSDEGESWTPEEGRLFLDRQAIGCRLYRGILTMDDGTLLMPAYLAYAGETRHGSRLLQSVDGGLTWTVRADIAPPGGGTYYNETVLSWTASGGLVAVMRTEIDGTHGPLAQSRSTDGGLSWSSPTELQVAFSGGRPSGREGVDPALLLLPNGILLLSSGRPDNWVAISKDGEGERWEDARITYVNYPADGSRNHGSSGYSGLAALASNAAFYVGDNCANSWGCPDDESGWVVDGDYRIWWARVDALTPNVGKLDLRGLALDGGLGDVDAAVDGRVGTAATGVPGAEALWLARLDRVHTVGRVGAMAPGGARVYVSEDGLDWGEPVVELAPGARALRYTDLESPVRAGFVRVEPLAPAGCEAADCVRLTELELYGEVDGFENDAPGQAPRGFDAALAEVVEGQGYGGGRALQIRDNSARIHATVSREVGPAEVRVLEFMLQASGVQNAVLFDLTGHDAQNRAVAAYHFAVTSTGKLRHYDATAATWSDLSADGRVPLDAWTRLRVIADANEATICVDEVAVATAPPSAAGVLDLSGLAIASAGTAPTGDEIRIDDLWLGGEAEGCAVERPPDWPVEPDSGAAAGTRPGERVPLPGGCSGSAAAVWLGAGVVRRLRRRG